ncbi:diguanylate cyclase [Halobacillus sp. A1]|uniref:diguanylate cyclase domain-containing protein n=1 Tax=Halobacillus sp. A1 TaxID=2880262 RepID=UPI0020A6A60A|nr:diguanylate cyclase [Halobacillus sp. A1]MCP3033307.1 diguanylate cyclase [Halobacillus sp. A1]
MFLDLFNNVAIIVALLFIAGKFFENRPLDQNPPLSSKVYAGLGAGLLGSLLILSTIEVTETVILDLRHIATIIAAMVGGPVSAIITGLIIGSTRLVIYGVTTASILASSIAVFMGLLLGYISTLPLNKINKYLTMNVSYILMNSFALSMLIASPSLLQSTLLFSVSTSIFGGIIAYYMTEYIRKSNMDKRNILYYKLIAESSTDVVSTHDKNGTIQYVSPSCEAVLGYKPTELTGTNAFSYFHPKDQLRTAPDKVLKGSANKTIEYRFKHKDGGYIWLEATFNQIKGLREGSDFIYSSREITERKLMEQELMDMNQSLKKLSNLDGLTGIPNRRSFDYALMKEWENAVQHDHPYSFILFDLDRFKVYNDTYGHLQGDECLRSIAEIVPSLLREHDFFSRYGGEEFAIILPQTSEAAAKEVAETLCKGILQEELPHINSDIKPFVTISAGVATLRPTDETDYTTIIGMADHALYQAKEEGRNTVRVFQPAWSTLRS